jgi:peptidoglycan/xylan/chitin deacetylase (PgdA/CDA1 family)
MLNVLQRIRRRVNVKRSARVRPLILMYHRVAAVNVDPWGLAVHPDRFEAHLAVLRKQRTPMRLSDFVRALDRETLPDDAVAVTFDDGYVDNLHHAKPRLAAAGVPATVFLATGAIGQRSEFWWDELARGILGRVDGGDSGWRAWQAPRNASETEYFNLWRRLRDVAPSERDDEMRRFRKNASQGGRSRASRIRTARWTLTRARLSRSADSRGRARPNRSPSRGPASIATRCRECSCPTATRTRSSRRSRPPVE